MSRSMHPQLEILLEVQDLHSQKRSLENAGVREVESEVFEMKVEDALEKLDEKIRELEERLDDEVAARHRRLSRGGADRSVVPVVEGICYGCFMTVPTAWASDAARNQELDLCDNCGRFLYHVA